MPLNIKNDEAHTYARELSALSGKSITEVVTRALREALDNAKRLQENSVLQLTRDLDDIALHLASLPVLDRRSPEEILGYNDIGVPE